ncbi:putative lipoprotein [Leptospira ryugenii]|uniref:Putative lipoprotein n=1 Tax=Leptospira ryugenii TaxID=1917863 RepID=A0A2P2DZG5_9LEPT|nr:tetratricopeptide repeat protein [Leptospira ryugenii]GBF50022.1 putative lipoprotein [Leptospira ryugenii]
MARKVLIPLLFLSLLSCDGIKNLGKSRWEKQKSDPGADEKDLVRWSEKLALEEAEISEMDEKIRKMVQKSNQAGALAWKIARGYMRAGSFERSSQYYQEALQVESKQAGYEIHSFESALPFFEKAIQMGKLDKQLLFEAALAYANASKDMGWEPGRRKRAIELFQSLTRLDPKDSRFPFQLALIYFDSSLRSEAWEGKGNPGYGNLEEAFELLDSILKVEPYNIPARFAKANFLYQIGMMSGAQAEYSKIKSDLEYLKQQGQIREPLEKNQSYQNVLKNLSTIQSQNPNL